MWTLCEPTELSQLSRTLAKLLLIWRVCRLTLFSSDLKSANCSTSVLIDQTQVYFHARRSARLRAGSHIRARNIRHIIVIMIYILVDEDKLFLVDEAVFWVLFVPSPVLALGYAGPVTE